eukprot:TRINITY_DN25834_c0_g1_i1.p1 TRINITY_DN25834_c0_g1~~TRINITY_DN25834_c0_g1_i1.p1  ORF type:complete len:526 (+),score=135.85 TRINITY_DN25834_c0_g1_i1:149-1726(+)
MGDFNFLDKGGANDPCVTFAKLNDALVLCKEEFSPWGWREYLAEFHERMEAEKRLRALNNLPGSGAQPKDGVIQGTPMWQERLDKMLLIEHLKRKLMVAHERMIVGTDLLLKSHAALVKNPLLADKFSFCIRHVPESKFDRLDILQNKLEEKRRLLKEAREHHEDYLITERRNRDNYLKRTTVHQRHHNNIWLLDDVFLSWYAATMKGQLTDLRRTHECMEDRNHRLETGKAALQEELDERTRQMTEALDNMTAEKNKFEKLYQRMVQAHEKAKRDLEATKGTAEGMKNMILVLSQEKTALEFKVQDLEEEKARMIKQLAELRDLVAQLRAEIRRECLIMKDTELALLATRKDLEKTEGLNYDLEVRLDRAVSLEVRLRDDIDTLQCELFAEKERRLMVEDELNTERALTKTVEEERDDCLHLTRTMEVQMKKNYEECYRQIWAIREKARRDLEAFKQGELQNVKDEFRKKTEAILRRNAILEKELAIGEEVINQIPALNALPVDDSKMCSLCRKVISYEGNMQM